MPRLRPSIRRKVAETAKEPAASDATEAQAAATVAATGTVAYAVEAEPAKETSETEAAAGDSESGEPMAGRTDLSANQQQMADEIASRLDRTIPERADPETVTGGSDSSSTLDTFQEQLDQRLGGGSTGDSNSGHGSLPDISSTHSDKLDSLAGSMRVGGTADQGEDGRFPTQSSLHDGGSVSDAKLDLDLGVGLGAAAVGTASGGLGIAAGVPYAITRYVDEKTGFGDAWVDAAIKAKEEGGHFGESEPAPPSGESSPGVPDPGSSALFPPADHKTKAEAEAAAKAKAEAEAAAKAKAEAEAEAEAAKQDGEGETPPAGESATQPPDGAVSPEQQVAWMKYLAANGHVRPSGDRGGEVDPNEHQTETGGGTAVGGGQSGLYGGRTDGTVTGGVPSGDLVAGNTIGNIDWGPDSSNPQGSGREQDIDIPLPGSGSIQDPYANDDDDTSGDRFSTGGDTSRLSSLKGAGLYDDTSDRVEIDND